jgi:Fe-Mn family superoxide dismutase
MIYTLPDLPYAYDALEPHFDARTMEIHHSRHHAGYVANLNKAIEGLDLGEPTIEELLSDIHTLPDDVQTPVRNHGGGHVNHSMFWTILSSGGGGQPRGELANGIDGHFGGFDRFREEFSRVAMGRFGSGWAWLCLNPDGRLVLESTPNQDSPFMYGHHPVLGLDLWEHAYYLKFQNRRADYIKAFFELVDWNAVNRRYLDAIRHRQTVPSA